MAGTKAPGKVLQALQKQDRTKKNPMTIQVYNHTLPEDCQVGTGKAEVVVTNADGGKFFYCFYHWAPMMVAFLLEKTKGFDRDEEVVATVGEIHLYI